jgi:hypothetical protein
MAYGMLCSLTSYLMSIMLKCEQFCYMHCVCIGVKRYCRTAYKDLTTAVAPMRELDWGKEWLMVCFAL